MGADNGAAKAENSCPRDVCQNLTGRKVGREIFFTAQKSHQPGPFSLAILGQSAQEVMPPKPTAQVLGVMPEIALGNPVADAVAVIPVASASLLSQRRFFP